MKILSLAEDEIMLDHTNDTSTNANNMWVIMAAVTSLLEPVH
jgi:hypothetical protein